MHPVSIYKILTIPLVQCLILTTPTGNAVGVGDAEEMLPTRPSGAIIEYEKKEVTDVRSITV